jgi:hypothetical protein
MPSDAETVAEGSEQQEPRWISFSASFAGQPQFLGRAGPIDIWLDTGDVSRDGAVPFLVKSETHQRWTDDAEQIIAICEDHAVHLTLHDECIIHQLCAPHNKEKET